MITRSGNRIFFNGEDTQIFGRSSFKAMAHLRYGNVDGFKNWIDHCRRYGFNLLRVFGETEYWEGHPMFGAPPTLVDVWDRGQLESGARPQELTSANAEMIGKLFNISSETGMAFEYVVDATLKHAAPNPIPWGTIGHCIRQTLAHMRKCQEIYPKALVMVNFHNEWDAHSQKAWEADNMDRAGALREVNMQATRARRWKSSAGEVKVSYTSPGPGYEPEQWPEAVILVDHGGRNDIEYAASEAPETYDLVTLHPSRGGNWWTLIDDGVFDKYLSGALPVYFSESKMWVDPEDGSRAEGWYSANSYTTDLDKYIHWMETSLEAGVHFVVHDEKGMQSGSTWPRRETKLEEYLGGTPPPPPPPVKCAYEHIIRKAYVEILQRDADQGGLEGYNESMKKGLSEASMRESLIRSEEYKTKFG